jgi:hypothetical protein
LGESYFYLTPCIFFYPAFGGSTSFDFAQDKSLTTLSQSLDFARDGELVEPSKGGIFNIKWRGGKSEGIKLILSASSCHKTILSSGGLLTAVRSLHLEISGRIWFICWEFPSQTQFLVDLLHSLQS